MTRREAADADADHQLVVRAAWEAARLTPTAAAAPPDDVRSRLFAVALRALRATLPPEHHDALSARYDANRPGFDARLDTRLDTRLDARLTARGA